MKRRIGLVRLRDRCGVEWRGIGFVRRTWLKQRDRRDRRLEAQADPVPYWWFHGTVEAGGRFFLNNPQRNGSAYLNQNSLAKYYEYSDDQTGRVFGISRSRPEARDGLYQIDVGGKNVGYSDQSYYFDCVEGRRALPQLRLGPNAPSLQHQRANALFGGRNQRADVACGCSSKCRRAQPLRIINPFLHQTDIGIQRDTASVAISLDADRCLGHQGGLFPSALAPAHRLMVSLALLRQVASAFSRRSRSQSQSMIQRRTTA